MKKKTIFDLVFVLIVFSANLIACTSPQMPSTSEAALTVSPRATARRSTFTPRPTFTPIPRSTLNPTLISSSQTQAVYNQMIVATQSVMQTLVAQYPSDCKYSWGVPVFSPDMLWMSKLCGSNDGQDYILNFSNKESRNVWELHYKDYIPQTAYLTEGGLSVIHWSKDGKYAYFNSHSGGDGGECFVTGYESGLGLFRLDLQTGNTRTILSPGENFVWYGFSFSPTDRRLIYGVRSRDLQVLDLTTGQSFGIVHPKDLSQSGGYLWRQDGLEFVYSGVTYSNEYQKVNYTLRLVDVQTGNEKILIESKNNCFMPRSWRENHTLILESYDENYNQKIIAYDLNLNTIVEISPTPFP